MSLQHHCFPPRRPAILLAIAVALVGVACSGDYEHPQQLRFRLLRDPHVFRSIQMFQIHVLDAALQSGAVATCANLAGARLDQAPLPSLIPEPVSIPWNGTAPTDGVTHRLTLPANAPTIIVVRGLARVGSAIHVVAAGCRDGLTFTRASSTTLEIDITATTGAACLDGIDCVAPLACHKGPWFNGGYCARLACSSDQDCPPATQCTSSPTVGNLCLRGCEAFGDCTFTTSQEPQNCEGRTGVTGCVSVCVSPGWQPTNACTP